MLKPSLLTTPDAMRVELLPDCVCMDTGTGFWCYFFSSTLVSLSLKADFHVSVTPRAAAGSGTSSSQ